MEKDGRTKFRWKDGIEGMVKNKKLGDCYEVHAKQLLAGLANTFGASSVLCHGTVWHPKTKWHGHCWIELNEDVVMDISNGCQVVTRREAYYRAGKVKDVKKYNVKQVNAMILVHGTYGPWGD